MDEEEINIPDWLQPGISFREFYGENNPNTRRVHIRAIVDEEYIVFRVWSWRKGRWYYYTEHCSYFTLRLRLKDIRNIKKEKLNAETDY